MNEPVNALPPEKLCTRCNDTWPADTEFFRTERTPGQPNRLALWCRACESEQKAEERATARGATANANSSGVRP